MDVDQGNFDEVLADFVEQVGRCDFVAIDTEMTGLGTSKWRKLSALDSVESRYQNAKDVAENLLVLQYGVCLFTRKGETGQLEARPYNFNVFPRPHSRSEEFAFVAQVRPRLQRPVSVLAPR